MTNMPVLDKNTYNQFLSMKTNKTQQSTGGFETLMKNATSENVQQDRNSNPAETTKVKQTSNRKTDERKTEFERETNRPARKKNEMHQTEKEHSVSEDASLSKPEELDRLMEDVAEEVAEILGVPVEQVLETLQNLEFEPADLLNAEHLKETAFAILDASPEMMLMNEELYQTITELTDTLEAFVSDWSAENDISSEQFERLLSDYLQKNEQITENTSEVSSILTQANQMDEKETVVITQESSNQSEGMIFDVSQNAVVKTVSTASEERQTGQQEKHSEHDHMEHSEMMTGTTVLNGKTQQDFMAQDITKQANLYVPDTQEIMDQITEYMRVQMRPEFTSIEMQLQPETLGTVHVQIASKEGAVTAQFAAQNEEVKAVLESQIVELRENLENQGVKVEAVEVTIAEYTMDKNPEGQQEQSDAERAFRSHRKIRRNLNLNVFEEPEDLTADEKLAVEMMRADGNSVDYTA